MEDKGDLFQSDGCLTKKAIISAARSDFNPKVGDGVTIALHLNRCMKCRKRRLNVTGDDIVESYEKEEKHGIWSRISSYFYRFFGGKEPFAF